MHLRGEISSHSIPKLELRNSRSNCAAVKVPELTVKGDYVEENACCFTSSALYVYPWCADR